MASLIAGVNGNAQIITENWYPPMTVNISGVFTYDSDMGGNYGAYMEWDMVKVRFATKDLFKLLNSSATFTNVLGDVTGVTQIPAGSVLEININQPMLFEWWNEWAILVTNRDGFSFQLNDVYDPVQTNYYTFLDFYHDYAMTSAKIITSTYASHEADKAAVHFTFNNGEGTLFELSGVGDFNWTAAPRNNSTAQQVSATGRVVGSGNAVYNDNPAVMQATLTVKGKGMAEFQPFEMWSRNMWYSTLGFPPLQR